MSGIDEYLDAKRAALSARDARIRAGGVAPVPLAVNALAVEVSGVFDSRAGTGTSADPARVRALQARVEAACPILNLLHLAPGRERPFHRRPAPGGCDTLKETRT